MSEEEIIKEIKERIIEPFYCFPNPTSIELKDKDVNLIEELIDLYIKLQYELEVEKIDNKYNQEERDEFTNETRYYTPEGEIYKTIIETYKCPKNYISKNKIRTLLHSYAIDDENFKKYLEEMLEEN